MSGNGGKRALGIDFGGTTIKIALVTAEGRIAGLREIDTARAAGVDTWMDRVAAGAEEAGLAAGAAGGAPVGIGVGVPGFVDFERGFVHELPNVPGWTGVRLAERLEQRFGIPAWVDNDCNAMALGECTFGAGRLYQHVVFATLGTGVGGAVLINNRLFRGARSMAGEIGHVSIDMNGIASPQGRGGLEQYVGNRRLVARAAQAMAGGRATSLRARTGGDPAALTVKLLAEEAARGDALSLELFDFMADCLATAFASITYVLQPQAFIVGGGVAQAGDLLFGPLRRHLRERLSPHFAGQVDVRPAALGPSAGVIGAATLALKA